MEENLTIPEGMDAGVVNLARAIRKQESGGDYQQSGDNGSSLGAYQWNNQPNGKSIPLQKGELPSNFKAWAKEVGLDENDFSPKNQDMVAYRKIKKLKDAGNNVVDIASIWNGGDKNRQDPNYITPSGLPSQKKGIYDVPAYAKAVNDYYQELKSKTENSGTPGSDSQTQYQPITSASIPNTQPQAETQDLKAPNIPIVGDLPGIKLAQGAGYGLASILGSQKGLIEANDQAIEIQGKLIQKIKENKSAGKDTSRLDKALQDITQQIQQTGNSVSDVGTGGISNKDVLKSAGNLALTATAGFAIPKGIGLLKNSGLLSKASALEHPEIQSILKTRFGSKAKIVNNLPKKEVVNTLTKTLDELSIADAKGIKGKAILKAIDELTPTVVEKKSLLEKLIKLGYNTAKNVALTKLLGDKLGGFIHKNTP